jgi:hypothetical protein
VASFHVVSGALAPIQLPTPWVYRTLSLRVNLAEREADHSPPPNARLPMHLHGEVFKQWIRFRGVILS